MSELRWSLIVLGLLVVAGVYLYSRRQTADARGAQTEERRREPVLGGDDGTAARRDPAESAVDVRDAMHADDGQDGDLESTGEVPVLNREDVRLEATGELPELESEQASVESEPSEAGAQRIIALRLVVKDADSVGADEVVLALREHGLRHGQYGIFHRYAKDDDAQPMFSAASLTEPGSFDLSRLTETRLAGLSLFMVLPGPCDPVEQFDAMVTTARAMARTLPLELLDETGSSWSIQRERYVREELIRYRHQPYLV